jgi:hypothetical protein
MKFKKSTLTKKLAITISAVLIVTGFLFISEAYFSYSEVRNMTDECYDNGGLPKIEKSGLSVEYFSCNRN